VEGAEEPNKRGVNDHVPRGGELTIGVGSLEIVKVL